MGLEGIVGLEGADGIEVTDGAVVAGVAGVVGMEEGGNGFAVSAGVMEIIFSDSCDPAGKAGVSGVAGTGVNSLPDRVTSPVARGAIDTAAAVCAGAKADGVVGLPTMTSGSPAYADCVSATAGGWPLTVRISALVWPACV